MKKLKLYTILMILMLTKSFATYPQTENSTPSQTRAVELLVGGHRNEIEEAKIAAKNRRILALFYFIIRVTSPF